MSDEEKKANKELGKQAMAESVNAKIAEAKLGLPIRALHQRRSGDVEVVLASEEEAARLRENDSWVKGLGQEARVASTSYGVIIHGVPTKSLTTRDGKIDMAEAILQIKKRNDVYYPPNGLQIQWAKWLGRIKENQSKASLVLQFETAAQANRLTYHGISIDQQMFYCRAYNPQCRPTQCFNCWGFGHTQSVCPHKTACSRCAGEHRHTHCPPDSTVKCASCGGSHEARSRDCKFRRQEEERIKEKVAQTPPQHPERKPSTDSSSSQSSGGFTFVSGGKGASGTRNTSLSRKTRLMQRSPPQGSTPSLSNTKTPYLPPSSAPATRSSPRRECPNTERVPLQEMTGNILAKKRKTSQNTDSDEVFIDVPNTQ